MKQLLSNFRPVKNQFFIHFLIVGILELCSSAKGLANETIFSGANWLSPDKLQVIHYSKWQGESEHFFLENDLTWQWDTSVIENWEDYNTFNKTEHLNNQFLLLAGKVNPSPIETDSSATSPPQQGGSFTGPSSVENELQESEASRERRSLFPSVDEALQPWFMWKQEVNQEIGLNVGLDYNAVYQTLTYSLNHHEAGGGIFRFYGDWTLVGRGSESPGSLVFKVENRHDYGQVPPQDLGFQAGYVGITSTQFSDYAWGTTNLYWKQRFNDAGMSFVIGKVDPTDYLDVYGLINPLTAFQNLAFSTNPAIAAPNQGLGAALGAMLSDNIYLIAGFSDANGDATRAGFNSFFNQGEFFKHIEVGWTSSPKTIYLDNVHLTAWHSDFREQANVPESWGLALSGAWFIEDRWMPFIRGGYSNGGAALLKGTVSAGLGYYSPETGNLFGFGLNWGQPADTSLDSQFTSEVFYRLQLTQNWAIAPNIQGIFNPALVPDKTTIVLFGIRSRINF